jgi:SanA protein
MNRIRKVLHWFSATRPKRWFFIYAPSALLLFTVYCNILVESKAKGKMFTNLADLPAKKTAVVFGTSPWARGGKNPFYTFRMKAAAALWNAGKIQYIIVSGDNSTLHYNEAWMMKKSLIAAGVPDSVIRLDYAGFRTLDSVVRCKWVFGQNDIIFVSQEFQNERALFIAEHFGINAVAYNAEDVPSDYSFKVRFREYFARVKAVLDVYLLGTQPRFPGPPEPIY